MLAEVAASILGWIVEQQAALAAKAVELATAFLRWIVETAKAMPGKLAEISEQIVTFLTELPGKLVSLVTSLGPKLAEVGLGLVKGIFSALVEGASIGLDFARAVVNKVIDFINDKVIGAINRSLEIDVGFGVTINPPDIPSLPRLAHGAVIDSPTVALIGEAGPELALPLALDERARAYALLQEAGVDRWPVPEAWRDSAPTPPPREALATLQGPAPAAGSAGSLDRSEGLRIEEGGVVFRIEPPAAHDPDLYAVSLSHRALPLLRRAVGR